jgi:hypothetical protein
MRSWVINDAGFRLDRRSEDEKQTGNMELGERITITYATWNHLFFVSNQTHLNIIPSTQFDTYHTSQFEPLPSLSIHSLTTSPNPHPP